MSGEWFFGDYTDNPQSTTSGATLTATWTTPPANGSFIVAVAVGKHNNGTSLAPTAPAGFTLMGTQFLETGTPDFQMTVWYKIAGAAEGNPSITVPAAYSTAARGLSFQAYWIGGQNAATPLDGVTPVFTTFAAGDTITLPSLTPGKVGSQIFQIVASNGADTAHNTLSGFEVGGNTNWNSVWQFNQTTVGSAHTVSLWHSYRPSATAPTTTQMTNLAGTTPVWIVCSFSLRDTDGRPGYVPGTAGTYVPGTSTTNPAVALSWTACADTGGSPITQYEVYRDFSLIATKASTAASHLCPNIQNFTSTAFYILPVSAVGKTTVPNVTMQTLGYSIYPAEPSVHIGSVDPF